MTTTIARRVGVGGGRAASRAAQTTPAAPAAPSTPRAPLPVVSSTSRPAASPPAPGASALDVRAAALRAYKSKRATHVELDHAQLAKNVRGVKEKLGATTLCAVLKANAYGHGAVEVAKVALQNGATHLAVATVAEGVELRAAGIEAPVLVLGWTSAAEAPDLVAFDLAATVMTTDAARALDDAARAAGKRALVHVKVDTGMHRLGVPVDAAVPLVVALAAMKHLDVEGIFTHFHSADCDLKATKKQLADFNGVVEALAAQGLRPRIAHAANSDATFALPSSHLDMARVGTALFGFQPGFGAPVLSWKTVIAHTVVVQPGEGVSYGHEFKATTKRTIAAIPVGWADGFETGPARWQEVLVNGKRAQVVGAICMDQAMIDVTDIGPVKPGDEVVLLGAQGRASIGAAEVARWMGGVHPVVVTGRVRPRSPSTTEVLAMEGPPTKPGWTFAPVRGHRSPPR